MVNSIRGNNSIPILLVDGDFSKPVYRNCFMKKRFSLMMFRKRGQQRFYALALQLLAILKELDAEYPNSRWIT